MLDLYAGSGAMGLEALSRGAAQAVFVEADREACRAIERNLDKLRLTGARSCCSGRAAGARGGGRRRPPLRPRPRRPALRPVRRAAARLGAVPAAVLAEDGLARRRDLVARRAGAAARQAHEPALRRSATDAVRARAMITAICPGTYDPVTYGHLDVIRRAAEIFDRVVVGVVSEPHHKQPMFSIDERVDFLTRGARRARERRGRRLLRARGRLRAPLGREDDGEGPPRDLGLRVGVPDEPPEPHARARHRDHVRDGEPAVQLRLVERREGDRRVRRARCEELVPEPVARRFRELFPNGRPGAPVSPSE